MTAIIYYYSRSGTTKKIAKELAKKLGCDAEMVDDGINRTGFFGFIRSGFQATRKKTFPLKPLAHMPSDFDLIIIGTPIWGGTMSSPVLSLIRANKKKIKAAAFFSTAGDVKERQCFARMEDALGKPPVAKLHLGKQDIKDGYANKMKKFLGAIKDHEGRTKGTDGKKKASGE